MAAWGYEFDLRVLKVSLTRSLRLLIERDSFQRICRIFPCQKLEKKKTVEPIGLFPNTKMLAK